MTNISDLEIEQEIIPLFDFTNTTYSRQALFNLFEERPSSVQEIIFRQDILKGFLANHKYLNGYSYPPADLLECYQYLEHLEKSGERIHIFEFTLPGFRSSRNKIRSQAIQLVLFFENLDRCYFSKIIVDHFPPAYKAEIQFLTDFLHGFNSHYFAQLIADQKFRNKHVKEIHKVILNCKANGQLKCFWKQFFLFEAYISVSNGISKNNFSFPTFTDTVLMVKQFYHPLLQEPVKNDLITDRNVILLTGPNMSGKSTLLKALGICVYLGHIGLGVPATSSEMPFYEHIFIHMYRKDDLANGHSQFMSDVMHLKSVVNAASNNQRCFGIFDELFAGTNPEDAFELSCTTIKGLSRFVNCSFFLSTHLHSLEHTDQATGNTIEAYSIDCEIKDGVPKFIYQLKKGWSRIQLGRLLFDNAGLNKMFANKK